MKATVILSFLADLVTLATAIMELLGVVHLPATQATLIVFLGLLFSAFAGIGVLSWLFQRLKTRTTPQLIHMKGVCAAAHDLQGLVAELSADDLRTPSVRQILRILIARLRRRLVDVAATTGHLKPTIADLDSLNMDRAEPDDIRHIVRDVQVRVLQADRACLQRADLQEITYRSVSYESAE